MNKDMLSNDLKETVRSREEIRQAMHEAFKANDNEAFSAAYEEMMQRVALDITEEYDQRFEELQGQMDERALEARGYKPLTSEEKKFYKALEESVSYDTSGYARRYAGQQSLPAIVDPVAHIRDNFQYQIFKSIQISTL